LAPGDDVRVWVWIKALKPGSFHVANHKVEFEQNGKEFFQILPVGYQGRVTANPAFPVHTKGELACIHAHA
jgi:hypothetical protein